MSQQRETGWFAEWDQEADRGGWQPTVQTATLMASLDVWFPTEADCERFIRDELVGLGAWEEQ